MHSGAPSTRASRTCSTCSRRNWSRSTRASGPTTTSCSTSCCTFAISPDRYHHPREDIAFDCLVKRDAGLAALVEHLKEEHRLIAAAGDSLHQLLAEASEGAIVSREKIDSAAQAYLVDYRRHIASEELTVMPRALALLTPEDWALVAHAVPAAIDPLFGEEADNSYRELRRLIALEAG